jgi:hypothetical protein
MQKRIRGKVFIINNETFENKEKLPYRQGSRLTTTLTNSLYSPMPKLVFLNLLSPLSYVNIIYIYIPVPFGLLLWQLQTVTV